MYHPGPTDYLDAPDMDDEPDACDVCGKDATWQGVGPLMQGAHYCDECHANLTGAADTALLF